MIRSGLLSVTFRRLDAQEIVRLSAMAELEGIEWGGDIHVPHGQVQRAAEIRSMTESAGLKVAAYGSYYKTGVSENESLPFEHVLDAAAALGAPTIRVWAGNRGSAEADERWWENVVGDSRRIAGLAQQAGITVSYEYHSNTLTDSAESAVRLLKEADHPNLQTLWQPPVGVSLNDGLFQLETVMPWLGNVHVYEWREFNRLPLADGRDVWHQYMTRLASLPGERYAMLEFVKDDSPDQLLSDAAVLKELIATSTIQSKGSGIAPV